MKRILRRALVVLSTLLVIGALVVAFLPKPIDADAVLVSRGPLRVTIDEDGETRCRTRFVIAAPVAGRLERPRIDEGQAVEAGQVLARLFPTPIDTRQEAEARARVGAAVASRREAESHLARTRLEAEQSRRSLARAERLVEQGLISRESYELALTAERTAAEAARAAASQLERAASEVQLAEAALIATTSGQSGAPADVVAPARGVVLRVFEESERAVPAGTPIAELGDPSSLEAVVDVLTSDAVAIRPGTDVELGGWGAPTARGRVRSVEPAAFTKLSALGVEEQRVNVIVDVLGDPGTLGVAYRIQARFVIWKEESVLRIPISALFRMGERWAIFAVENGRARQMPVELGWRGATEVQVLSGVDEGQEILLHPPNDLVDGTKVRTRPDGS